MKYLLFLFLVLLSPTSYNSIPNKVVKGITMVAPPKELSDKPIENIRTVNAEWVALVPYGFSRDGQPGVRFFPKQWWGETPEGIKKCTRIAHQKGLKVMIKPQVYIHNGWIGDMTFKKEKDWQEWENSYRDYILTFARIAAEEKAEMFCIGTEYKIAAQKRENFWRALIKEVRSFYNGDIIYSSNWDGYKKVPFWDELDYIGISAYFPLTDMETPTLSKLRKEWKPIVNTLKRFSKKKNKKILFTEYGYLSVDQCAHQAWELEKKIHDLDINEQAQANAYHALLETFWQENFWAGGFLWKWFPDGMGHEGYPEKDYTPQGKQAELVIQDWYGRS